MIQKQIGKSLLKIRLELEYNLENYCSFLGISVFTYLSYENGLFIKKDKKLELIISKIKLLMKDNQIIKNELNSIEKQLNKI